MWCGVISPRSRQSHFSLQAPGDRLDCSKNGPWSIALGDCRSPAKSNTLSPTIYLLYLNINLLSGLVPQPRNPAVVQTPFPIFSVNLSITLNPHPPWVGSRKRGILLPPNWLSLFEKDRRFFFPLPFLLSPGVPETGPLFPVNTESLIRCWHFFRRTSFLFRSAASCTHLTSF